VAFSCVAATTALGAECDDDGEVSVLVSPRVPAAGGRVRVLVASDVGAIGELAVTDGEGRVVSQAIERLGGPPWSAVVTIDPILAGSHRVEATRNGERVGCATFAVGRDAGTRLRAWDRDTEALYSAWIEHLFAAPPDASVSLDALQDVLMDPQRNLLVNHLGRGEDDARGNLGQPPDCADLAYVLRAYFGWKVGLPIGYRPCSRGTAAKPPSCGAPKTATPADGTNARGWFASVATQAMNTVHSGSARTALPDDATDFYPVALTREALRPGTLYADPYGHTLMIVQWVPQTAARGGMLLAVDAQPDNSVARKRFWEGTFLFADDVAGAGPGFKAFRPLVARGGGLVPLGNAALRDDPRFAPFSLEQASLSPDQFYARLARLINPNGLRPEQAHRETLDALVEQLTTRVDSVRRGEEYVRAHPSETIAMPEGASIFETIGPWEDYATPSRDLRLLIAMKVLLTLPERIVAHPELFVLDGVAPTAAASAVEQAHARATEERKIEYVRSDGSPWPLTVAELLARKSALEMAYNPNDCIEVRWGAPQGSEERSTCRRNAPAEQRTRMGAYRPWFRDGRRPSR
jgi:hypothetical protein